MRRTDGKISYPDMLNRINLRIEKLRAYSTRVRLHCLPEHPLKPDTFSNFDVVIKEEKVAPLGSPDADITHFREVEIHLFIYILSVPVA